MTFVEQLTLELESNANPVFASQMKSYLRDHFELYGIKMGPRRILLNKVLSQNLDEVKNNVRIIARDLYELPFREMHHCGTELVEKYLRKSYMREDIHLIEYLIVTNSWWDTVDYIAKLILGKYLLTYPDEIAKVIPYFANHENMWLNRSAILFQLGYKNKTDQDLLFNLCLQHKSSDEFFIQKAIGWALREYGKTNPDSVLDFVKSAGLKPLSTKEAIRNII